MIRVVSLMALLLVGALFVPAHAKQVPAAYIQVAKEYDVPADILFAIALTESGRRSSGGRMLPYPWAMNLSGRAIYFESRAEADMQLAKFVAEGLTPDIGLMQVNWRYHKHRLGDVDQAFDPWLNLRAGANVLRDAYREKGRLVECRRALPLRNAFSRESLSRARAALASEARMIRYACPLLLAITLPVDALAGSLQVVYDSGNTTPLEPLLEASGIGDDGGNADDMQALPSIMKAPPTPQRASDSAAIVNSPSLTPGQQVRIAVGVAGKVLSAPIFLVGADDISIQWLQRHREHLASIGAVGLIIQSDGLSDIRRVQQAAGRLPISAGSGEMMAEHFGLKHYPVLIGPQWIEQ